MAGGLGTRMRSAVPKHFHPILGRRMVDWVIETGREAGAEPLVVVASPAARDEFAEQRRRRSPSRSSRSARATPCARRGPRSTATTATCSCSPATRRCSPPSCSRELVETHRRERPAATILSAEPPDPRVYGRIVRDADGSVAAHRRGNRRDARGAGRSARSTRRSTSSAADALWPALEQLQPKNVQGELYLTDAIEILVAGGAKVAAHVAADHRETDGVNTRVELAQAGARRCATASTSGTCSPASRSSIRRRTWIEPTVELEADVTIHPFTILRGATTVATRCARSTPTRSRSTPHRAGTRSSDRSVTFAPERSSATPPRRAPSWRSRTRGIGDRTKVPHLSYIGDADIGEDTNIGAGAITANFPHSPGEPKERHDDRQQRQDRRSTMVSSRPWRWVTEHGSLQDRS